MTVPRNKLLSDCSQHIPLQDIVCENGQCFLPKVGELTAVEEGTLQFDWNTPGITQQQQTHIYKLDDSQLVGGRDTSITLTTITLSLEQSSCK